MTADGITFFANFYAFLAIIVCAVAAIRLENRLKLCNPETRPYRWGFYVGCIGVAGCPLALLTAVAGIDAVKAGQPGLAAGYLTGAVYLAVQAVCGWFIIKRKRWAWVAGTATSFNIIWWVANSIYARNRWQEFAGVPYARPPEDIASDLLSAAEGLKAQGQEQEALAVYQRIVDTYPNTPGAKGAVKGIENLKAKIA
jgi:hypothetical protein